MPPVVTDDLRRELDQLRRDIQREIDLRLKAEAEARENALAALNKKRMDTSQLITWALTLVAVLAATVSVFHAPH